MIGTKILEERKSKFNGNLRVVRSFGLGTYVQAEGLTQSGGVVEEIWQSTLHKIRDSRFQIQNVLILGLGGGTAAKLIQRFWPDAKIMGVDIDRIMVELGEKYLGLDRNEIEIEIGDALEICKKLKVKSKKFDLVIVDLYNGDKFPEKFATEDYIQLIKTVLASSGIAVFNRLYFAEKKLEAEKFGEKLEKVFKSVKYFRPISNIMFLCSK